MNDVEFDQAVWERIQELTPFCQCGARTQPGALGPNRLVFVCTECSSVAVANPAAIDAIRAVAVADVERIEADA